MQQNSVFLKGETPYPEAQVVMFGAPMDYTVCFRPGARFGPASIRQASYGLEHYSLQFGDSLCNRAFHDAGDLVFPFGNAPASLAILEAYAADLVNDGKFPLALGGEHLISLPVIRAVHARYPKLHVLHFDAHADLAQTYFGESVTHATVMRRVLDFLPKHHFFQFGIRSADAPEVEFAKGVGHYPFAVHAPLRKVLAQIPDDVPLYVSLDVDVLDPAFAPGTGTPEAGGITPSELFSALQCLQGRHIVGADFVEVAPDLDPTHCTAVLGAKVVREMLLSLFPAASSVRRQEESVTW